MNKTPNNKIKLKSIGRPKKAEIKISRYGKNMNINKDDIIPASLIKTSIISSEEHEYLTLFIKSDNSFPWVNLLNILKSNGLIYINITFSKTGIVINNTQEDLSRICIRLMMENMISYKVKERTTIRIETNQLFKVFKTIKKKGKFLMLIDKKLEYLDIAVMNKNKTKKYSIKLQTNIDIKEYYITATNKNYDLIFIIESEYFLSTCKDMNEFKINDFTMSNNNNECSINWSNDKLICFNTIPRGDHELIYCKELKDNDDVIKKEYKLNTFFKYSNASKISKILKIYVSKDDSFPSVLEYDIDNNFGVFQIFIN
jgi:hypothetical protein